MSKLYPSVDQAQPQRRMQQYVCDDDHKNSVVVEATPDFQGMGKTIENERNGNKVEHELCRNPG